MRQSFTNIYLWLLIVAFAISVNFAFSSKFSKLQTDTTYLHYLKSKSAKNSDKNSLHLVLPPLRPAYISTTKVMVAKPDDKLLNNVQVYPNPVTDILNLKYELSRSSNVTVKIMDVLGNEVVTIFSQRLEPGEKNYTYSINNKLNRGFYFVRVVAGTESVIKRISVL